MESSSGTRRTCYIEEDDGLASLADMEAGGDRPFCSEECRQEQIEVDEAKEKNLSLSSSKKGLRKKDRKKSSSPTKAQNYPFCTGTVAAA
ncbi:hypothetical protein MRB53_013839 [Persea americana]|uniref:Uncharacterized protein n=1 Tax=Persea americana TaxID=3435 RepID=A0ACC2K9R5_PERAE|nr:hypothetical protein MRB53_013839 [Persea americana]